MTLNHELNFLNLIDILTIPWILSEVTRNNKHGHYFQGQRSSYREGLSPKVNKKYYPEKYQHSKHE